MTSLKRPVVFSSPSPCWRSRSERAFRLSARRKSVFPAGATMSQLQDRIAQFRKMANDDPDNELGHYRLGQLLAEAGEHEQAVQSFRRTLELSPHFSKVYHLLAQSLLRLDQRDEAIQALREGLQVADQRGDRMPRDEMARMLTELGETPPEPSRLAVGLGGVGGAGEGGFRCQR